MLEQPQAHVGNQRRRKSRVPSFVPDRDDRGEDPRPRQNGQNLDQRLEILLAERIVDQEFQAQRHNDIEQRLDHDAEADECQYFPVVPEEGFDERIDRRQRSGGFPGGKDDEILIVLVILNIQFIIVVIFIAARRRRGHLIADSAVCRASASSKFLVEFRRNGIIRGSGH